jgi:exopolyphosphatase/guanosine-5'-triphosphate,3'-diphosphate pyrophosphatase
MVRLGAGGLDGKSLTPTAMNATLQALHKFKRLANSYQVDEIVAAATSATREADNGGDFLAQIDREIGIRARVISGTEEARLIHLAACYGVNVGSDPAVVIDIGGGSVEITLGTQASVRLARSFKVGVIRLVERYVTSDPLSDEDERRLGKVVSREIAEHVERIVRHGFKKVIGTSGTILSLGGLASGAKPGVDLRNRPVAVKQIHKLRTELVSSDLAARLRRPGLDPRRADIIVGGAVLLDTILRKLGATELTLCDLALREGLVLDYIQTNQARIAQAERYPDVRRRSIVELAQRCNYWSAHAQHSAKLSLTLFDQTRSVHGLGDREREWIEYGALLHDIGNHISYGRHHRHSYYLIKNGDLRGFAPEEIETIGLIARYHRRGTLKKGDGAYQALPKPMRRAVRLGAALVHLTEGLDRSHAQVFSRVQVSDRSDGLLLKLYAAGDAELEIWAAQRHVGPLEAALDKTIRFEVTGVANAQQPDKTARVPRKAVRRRGNRRLRQDDAARAPREVVDVGRS